jgi:putative chitinase
MRASEFITEGYQQGTRWTGDDYYRHLAEQGHDPANFSDEELEEGWKQWAAAGALGLGALGAHGSIGTQDVPQSQLAQKPTITQQAPASMLDGTEKYLATVATQAGIKGAELAQFLAQLKHESFDFTHMDERGGSNYYKQKYDPEFAPKTAKILGNKHAGDGERYHGRGYIQLTGHDNYARAGKELGLDLVNHPELAADPANAAKIAVWFWQNKTKNITNFADTKSVTHKINPALKGLRDRQENFAEYSKLFKIG